MSQAGAVKFPGGTRDLRQSLAASQTAREASEALARSLQESLLPPVLQQAPGLEAAASYRAASAGAGTVVGDFYDLYRARGPWWSAVIGDVCGKGVEAAKVTALARYTLRADAGDHLSPAAVLGRLNAAMLAQNSPRFLTAAQATFRTGPSGTTGRLCLAGHPPALVRRADGRVEQVGAFGTLLGVVAEPRLADTVFALAPGDLLLLYTDGASEAHAEPDGRGFARALFGERRLTRALADTGGMDAARTVGRIGEALSAFTGGWAGDDTALLALRVPAIG